MDKKCGRCGGKLIPSAIDSGYDWQCLNCDEDFYDCEIFVIDNEDNSIVEIQDRIRYLEDKEKCCACSKDDLYELEELKEELEYLESENNDEKENN